MSSIENLLSLRTPADPSDSISEDDSLRALMAFTKLFNTVLEQHPSEEDYYEETTCLVLEGKYRNADGTIISRVQASLSNTTPESYRGKEIRIEEFTQSGGGTVTTYKPDAEGNAVVRYDNDKAPIVPEQRSGFEHQQTVSAMVRVINQKAAIKLGYNNQPVDTEEIERLQLLLASCEPL